MALGSKTLLWFDEPFSAWEECAEPQLPNGLTVTNAKWYQVAGAATWIAIHAQSPLIRGQFSSNQKHPERPALWHEKYLMLSKIEGPSEEYVSWFGEPLGKGDYRWWRVSGAGTYAVDFTGPATREPELRIGNELAAFDRIFSVPEHSVTEAREHNDVTNLVWALIRAERNLEGLSMKDLKYVVQLPTQNGVHRAVFAIQSQTNAPQIDAFRRAVQTSAYGLTVKINDASASSREETIAYFHGKPHPVESYSLLEVSFTPNGAGSSGP